MVRVRPHLGGVPLDLPAQQVLVVELRPRRLSPHILNGLRGGVGENSSLVVGLGVG